MISWFVRANSQSLRPQIVSQLKSARAQSKILVLLATGGMLGGCAHAPVSDRDAETAYREICEKPHSIPREVRGSLWIKSELAKKNMEFPANAVIKSPESVELEVIGLLGERMGTFTIEGDHYVVRELLKGKERTGQGDWKGIPIRWVTQLFLGQNICPPSGRKLEIRSRAEGGMRVTVLPADNSPSQVFEYEWKTYAERPWITGMNWLYQGSALKKVHLEFDGHHPEDGAPLRWTATSSEAELKIRWRDRELVR